MASTIIITARNLTHALADIPDSSAAYESGDEILSIIEESKEMVQSQQNGDKQMVSDSSHTSQKKG